MQRDKRGRFVKKALQGTTITVNGKRYFVKSGANEAFTTANANNTWSNMQAWFDAGNGKEFLQESSGFDPSYNETNTTPTTKSKFTFDKNNLANFLELVRAGIGASVNNKIAERAIESEKPLLQDVGHQSDRPIYGDYQSKLQGEQMAAQLRNAASKPLTSDGALQQNVMLQAQLKGNEYIDQGNQRDNALIKQTRELAWDYAENLRKERQAASMENRKEMLQAQKNISSIENMRDSANYSQIFAPVAGAIEQRLRTKGVQDEDLQKKYQKAVTTKEVWSDPNLPLTETQKELRNKYLSMSPTQWLEYLNEHKDLESDFIQLQKIMETEIIKRQAAIDGVQLNITHPTMRQDYGVFSDIESSAFKKGGTIYKARLTARTRDNDRADKSIESSKKIAARFLEKALDSLYTYNDVELIAKPKNKKRKYQGGGGIPWVGFTPVFATSEYGAPVASKESKKDSNEENLTSKDILELLKDMDGLPSDMKLIADSLYNFHLQDEMDPLKLASSSNIASRYIKLVNQIKVANFNKKEYDQAFNNLKTNGGLHEYAITSEGKLIGMNAEGDFKYFSTKDILEGKSEEQKYALLTNSNLLYLRANSTDAAFNHELTTVAQNGIGMEVVQTMINSAITNLGTSTNSQEGYVSTEQGKVIEGLESFYKAVQASDGQFDGTINDLYEYKYLTKSQAEQAKKAVQYIYRTLPVNARTLLKVKSNGTDEGAIALIETLLSSKISPETQFTVDLVGGPSHKKTKSDGGGDDKYFNHIFRAAMGLGSEEQFVINPGTTNTFKVIGTTIPIMASSSSMIEKDLLSDVKSSTMGQMLITTQMSVAGQHVDSSAANKIYLTDRRATLVDLPYTYEEGTNSIIPDYKLLEQKDQVDNYVKNNNLSFKDDFQQIQKFIKDNKFTIKYNKQGEVQFPNVKRFALFNANFSEDIFTDKKIKNGKYVKPLSKEDALNTYNEIMQQNSWTKKDWNYDVEGWFSDDIYKGTIAIPVDTAFLNLVTKDLDSETVLELAHRDKERLARENFNYDNRQLGQ